MKVALCVCGRLGNRYVSEYVKHYKNLGFDYFDNLNTVDDPHDGVNSLANFIE